MNRIEWILAIFSNLKRIKSWFTQIGRKSSMSFAGWKYRQVPYSGSYIFYILNLRHVFSAKNLAKCDTYIYAFMHFKPQAFLVYATALHGTPHKLTLIYYTYWMDWYYWNAWLANNGPIITIFAIVTATNSDGLHLHDPRVSINIIIGYMILLPAISQFWCWCSSLVTLFWVVHVFHSVYVTRIPSSFSNLIMNIHIYSVRLCRSVVCGHFCWYCCWKPQEFSEPTFSLIHSLLFNCHEAFNTYLFLSHMF